MSIEEMCLQLPIEDRTQLCNILQESITRERKMGIPVERPAFLYRMMADVLGVDDIPVKSRRAEFVWARSILAYQLVKEGMTASEAGRFLGKDHSTIIYMRRRVEDALMYPKQYTDVIYIWKQFQKKIEDETTDKGTSQDIVCL